MIKPFVRKGQRDRRRWCSLVTAGRLGGVPELPFDLVLVVSGKNGGQHERGAARILAARCRSCSVSGPRMSAAWTSGLGGGVVCHQVPGASAARL
jgi:hypothetical protein